MKRISGAPEQAQVIDLAHDGRGVARIEGKTVFVADTLPGERIVLRRTRRHRNFDEAICEQVLEASPERVEPRCPHFGTCGGCALQHASAQAQVALKERQLLETLTRIGAVAPLEVLPPLTGPTWGYRRRARLGVKSVPKKGRVLVGFRERSAPYIADLHGCPVLAPPADALIDPLAELIAHLTIATRIPQVEVAVAEGACALVLRVLDPPAPSDLEALARFERSHGLQLFLQPGGPQSLYPLTPGGAPLSYSLPAFGVSIEFGPADFIQVNGELNARMVERAVALLEPAPGQTVLDLFCGLGNFSLPLARSGAEVVAVEGEESLVARARANAERNGLPNVAFHVANLFEDVAGRPWAERRYGRVLLDPPRAGAREVLPVVARSGAARVVYISCHPGSLARDAGILVQEHGFRLSAAGVMDMFPHTTHVEAMAVFDR
ncbi:MAG TPA: 23S rRNA (uracil(1939)-C(5))-methyltransferase RlmD [Steroidobacteraceae bacterium]|nr:23S rRNA (uracil(1939)-C(5))-methyltransferase RlmD [Steroidobacteraceae bacterium]